jgi:hypothetical protein
MKDATIVGAVVHVGTEGKGSTSGVPPFSGGEKSAETIPFGLSYKAPDVDDIFLGCVAGVESSRRRRHGQSTNKRWDGHVVVVVVVV